MLHKLFNIRPGLLICSACLRRQQQVYNSHWTSKYTRAAFLDYFQRQHEHQHYPPSSTIPPKGSGTFFTNAGMNQFKPIFLGTVTEDSPLYSLKRAVNSQKCIRLSGKHNDLDEVGLDGTHHTFFEMLGSWSFGDYFKKEAIPMAWELMTKVYNIPADRLYVTYFGGDATLELPADLECRDIWLQTGVSKERVVPGSIADNFWEMGNAGPCGPCTEIHYDFIGGRDASPLVNTGHADVVELWNLVFMQYNRLGENEMELLPSQHVDTGMGLERLLSVLQNKRSNYDTDLFSPLISTISQNAQAGEYRRTMDTQTDISYRIVSDHARMMCVCIADGILPSNQGQDGLSVKLKQIMQRSFLHQRKYLGCPPMTASLLVDPIIDTLGEAFPELSKHSELIKNTICREEDLYYEYISDASTLLNKYLHQYPQSKILTADDIKNLRSLNKDLELPSLDLLAEVADDYGLTLDDSLSVDTETAQSGRSSEVTSVKSTAVSSMLASRISKQNIPATDDSTKYRVDVSSEREYEWSACDGRILALSTNEQLIESANDSSHPEIGVITDSTCFYSEGGGQLADVGRLVNDRCKLRVIDVQLHGRHVIHKCYIESGTARVGDKLHMSIDQDHRTGCALNHTATHLLGHALRKVVSGEIKQAGSTISSEELTFTYTSQGETTLNQLSQLSQYVNQMISDSIDISTIDLPYSTVAQVQDVIKLDTHQYPSVVRVVSVGPLTPGMLDHSLDLSAELCGGTHAANTKDLQQFVITGLAGQRQGVKRLTAVTGVKAVAALQLLDSLQSLVNQLVADVASKSNADTWSSRLKEIYQMYGTQADQLPKIEREILLQRLKQSKTSDVVKQRERRQTLQQLKQAMAELLKENPKEAVIVAQLDFANVKDAANVLGKVKCSVPVFVYNQTKHNSGHLDMVCYCPSNYQDKTWLTSLASLTGSDVEAVKTRSLADIYSVRLSPPVTDIKRLIVECLECSDIVGEKL